MLVDLRRSDTVHPWSRLCRVRPAGTDLIRDSSGSDTLATFLSFPFFLPSTCESPRACSVRYQWHQGRPVSGRDSRSVTQTAAGDCLRRAGAARGGADRPVGGDSDRAAVGVAAGDTTLAAATKPRMCCRDVWIASCVARRPGGRGPPSAVQCRSRSIGWDRPMGRLLGHGRPRRWRNRYDITLVVTVSLASVCEYVRVSVASRPWWPRCPSQFHPTNGLERGQVDWMSISHASASERGEP